MPGYRYTGERSRPGAAKPCQVCGHPKTWHERREASPSPRLREATGRFVSVSGRVRHHGRCILGPVGVTCGCGNYIGEGQ